MIAERQAGSPSIDTSADVVASFVGEKDVGASIEALSMTLQPPRVHSQPRPVTIDPTRAICRTPATPPRIEPARAASPADDSAGGRSWPARQSRGGIPPIGTETWIERGRPGVRVISLCRSRLTIML